MAYAGAIKSYGAGKGFGFIASEMVAGDVFFMRKDLPEDLQLVLTSGDVFNMVGRPVVFDVAQTQDGKAQAKNVKVVGTEGEQMVGEIKAFSDQNGYGFITSSFVPGDIYFQKREVITPIPGMNIKGMKVKFTSVSTPDGKVQGKQVSLIGMGMPSPMAMPFGGMAAMAAPTMGKGVFGKGAKNAAMNSQAVAMAQMSQMSMGLGSVPEGSTLVGVVKSFDPLKGWGFISSTSVPIDIYFKSAEQLLPGTQVTFNIHWTADGKAQANSISAPMAAGSSYIGAVKSYNAAKGWGFIEVPGQSQDVYFQKKDVPDMLKEDALVGYQFQFSVAVRPDGKPMAQGLLLAGGPAQGVKRSAGGDMANPAKRAKMGGTPAAFASQAGFSDPAMSYQLAMSGGMNMGLLQGASGAMYQGTVKTYSAQKGFGFISCASVPGDIYFQRVQLPAIYQQQQMQNRTVTFDLKFTMDGKPQASAVNVIG
jgi:cold shock CspA family protein